MKDQGTMGHQEDGSRPEGGLDAQALFLAHGPFVTSFLRRLGTPSAEVDDLVQETFLIAHRKGGYVPGAGQPRTWLAAIALRVASTNRRSRTRRRESDDDDALLNVASAHDADADLEARRSLERVQRALAGLDLDHRAAFVLFELDGESCESIAAAFGVAVGTVYSRLYRVRSHLLAAYSEPATEGGSRQGRPRLVGGT